MVEVNLWALIFLTLAFISAMLKIRELRNTLIYCDCGHKIELSTRGLSVEGNSYVCLNCSAAWKLKQIK